MILEQHIIENKTTFISKVKSICNELKINPNWLMGVMYKESNLNPKAVNIYSGATGLIQFMPSTAAALGTSTSLLKNMNNVEQLDYVKKYLQPFKNRMNSFTDTYFAVFFPAAIGKNKDTILETTNLSASKIAQQNPSMDGNRDQKITVQEVENWLFRNFTQTEILELKKKT